MLNVYLKRLAFSEFLGGFTLPKNSHAGHYSLSVTASLDTESR